jgi:hypothetical protein
MVTSRTIRTTTTTTTMRESRLEHEILPERRTILMLASVAQMLNDDFRIVVHVEDIYTLNGTNPREAGKEKPWMTLAHDLIREVRSLVESWLAVV